jgi:hypothetical protein
LSCRISSWQVEDINVRAGIDVLRQCGWRGPRVIPLNVFVEAGQRLPTFQGNGSATREGELLSGADVTALMEASNRYR